MKRNGALPHRLRLNSRVPRLFNSTGFTLGWVSFVWGLECDATLRSHEYRHVWHLVAVGAVAGVGIAIAAALSLVSWWWLIAAPFAWWVVYLLEYVGRIAGQLARGNVKTTLKAAYRQISWEREAYAWADKNHEHFDPIVVPR